MEQIGRYRIERLLARGGMAEVYFGTAQGPGGFAKSLVIKRVLHDLSDNREFVQLFLDEARLAALLNHPNVVQVFDFGEDQGAYFLAMEYVEGATLRSILRYFQARAMQFPIALAIQLVIGICEGLHYAHGLVDRTGASYNIVHRDISPENLLVSVNGTPKIVDFGIAKAATRVTQTEKGFLRGKHGYMAPEQIQGLEIDRRVDVYALGVTLYELLVGRRPYDGDTDLAIIYAAIGGKARPASEVNPLIPAKLSGIVARAMASARTERYPDARSFQAALEDFLLATGQRVSTEEISRVVREVAAERRATVGSQPPTLPVVEVATTPTEGLLAVTSPLRPLRTVPTQPTAEVPLLASQSASPSFAVAAPVPTAPVAPAAPLERRPPWIALGGGAGLVLVLALTAWAMRRPVASLEPARKEMPPLPAPVAISPPPVQPAPAPTDAGAAAPTVARIAEPPAKLRAATTGLAFLTVRSDPWCEVTIDGVSRGVTPLFRLPLPAGTHKVVLQNATAGAYREETVRLSKGEDRKLPVLFPKH